MRHEYYIDGRLDRVDEVEDEEMPTVHTPLEILSMLTESEYTGLWSASQQSPQMARWFDMLRAASEVRSDDPRTVAGLQAAVAAGLLTAARVREAFGVEVGDGE